MEGCLSKEYCRTNLNEENYNKILEQLEYLYITGCYEKVVNSCKIILSDSQNKNSPNEPQFKAQLLHSLVKLKRISEAEGIVKEWLLSIDKFGESKLAMEKTLRTFPTLKTEQEYDSWMKKLQTILKSFKKDDKHFDKIAQPQISCIYCNLLFKTNSELMVHCSTPEHEAVVMSDDGHDWFWRAPPRGGNPGTYTLCSNWEETMTCPYGIQCVEAHGEAELTEWKERFRYRELRISKAKEKNLFGKSYRETFLEKWSQSKNTTSEHLNDVEVFCSSPLKTTVSFKTQSHEFKFCLKSTKALVAVALLKDESANHFYLSKVVCGGEKCLIENTQEFVNLQTSNFLFEYKINILFKAEIFGTFRQSVIFDFGAEPVLVKHLCVDVVPDSEIEKIEEIRKEVLFFGSERWTKSNSEIIAFISPLGCYETDWERKLKKLYPEPDENFILSSETVHCKKLSKFKYKEIMHELLMVEEMARLKLLSSHNLKTELQLAPSYTLSPDSTAASTTKYALKEELFAFFPLCTELSEDTPEGRLILRHCNSVLLKPKLDEDEEGERVYQAIIEDKTKDAIYLRLSAQIVSELKLNTKMRFKVQIQFELNRTPNCEWHFAIDSIRDYGILFPETYIAPVIPWSPSRQWSSSLDSRLNLKQKEAVMAITTPLSVKIPPILIIGPFGTGKTFALAQAVQELIKDDKNKILLCTHSNSAADLYIKDYLDLVVENGEENARPLRIYYQKRWVATVSPVVQKYCLIRTKAGNVREFYPPTIEDVERHKVVVVTLATSVYLSEIGVLPGTFTHILLDEAAQALECETITPLGLATRDTRIVLAGDHMQLGPDIFSDFNVQKNLHVSLLERLYYHYPANFPCKILLRENYRAHEVIIQFTSDSFYDQKLVASSKQPRHPVYHPLTFFTARGEDVQCKNSTAFHNDAEVYEIATRVTEIMGSWPKEWGKINESSIGVFTPYPDQVFRIRAELRKRRINVCVERVLNVQGKQFRVVVLSTVRTRDTCKGAADEDYGFLTNSKLLNTAITRAQSLVAIVGDPIAVCSLGKCSKIFEKFIQICNENGSLLGISWSQLKYHLDSIELKKIYTLNPLAPEFIPRKYRPRVNNGYPYNYNYMFSPLRPVCPPMFYGYRPMHMTPPPHFPQPQPQPVPNVASPMNNNISRAQIVSDCVNLLPPNISLAELMTKPPHVLASWYKHLKEGCGLDAANKFQFLLMICNQKGSDFCHSYTEQMQKSNPLYKRQGNVPVRTNGEAENGSREQSRSTENSSNQSLMSNF